jgi:hypothetical protein
MSLSLADPGLLKGQAYINGQWVNADDGATFPVTNPADGELIIEVARAGSAETARAIAAADAAMQAWKKQPAKARAGILRKWFDLMMEHQEDLAQIMTAEQGKVLVSHVVKSPTGLPSSSGLASRPSASTAMSSPGPLPTSASSASSSQWAWSRPSPRGISPMP